MGTGLTSGLQEPVMWVLLSHKQEVVVRLIQIVKGNRNSVQRMSVAQAMHDTISPCRLAASLESSQTKYKWFEGSLPQVVLNLIKD